MSNVPGGVRHSCAEAGQVGVAWPGSQSVCSVHPPRSPSVHTSCSSEGATGPGAPCCPMPQANLVWMERGGEWEASVAQARILRRLWGVAWDPWQHEGLERGGWVVEQRSEKGIEREASKQQGGKLAVGGEGHREFPHRGGRAWGA